MQLDPEGIHRSLLNIVGNAFDAVKPIAHPRVSITDSIRAGLGLLEVSDNGIGIPPYKIEDVFKPFVVQGRPKGYGLRPRRQP